LNKQSSDSILEKANKGLKLEDCINAAKLIKTNSKILVEAYWIVGLPGSTQESFRKNIDLINYLMDQNIIDLVSTSTVFTPLPGSPFFEKSKDYGITIKKEDWKDYIRSNFFPIYRLSSITQKKLYDCFLDFEKFLLKKYSEKLDMSLREIENFHKFVLNKKPEDIRWN
jgi:radical SAM superfamily enzyme YgiQ (UPF0313 family)